MAEVIGLVASLITLAGASAQLATTLLDVANVIKSAEYEARHIAIDINGFSSYLTQLSMIVDTPNIKTEKLREITVVLIAACKTLIEDLKMLIGQPVQHDPARRAFTISMVRFRFRWMRVGPKVMFVKSLIDSFKTTIVVLVSTMNLAVVLERNAPESISESLKTQVESNIKFAEDATECLHYHTTIQQDEVPSFTPTVESSAATELEDATQGAGGELIVSRLRPSDERSLAVHDATLVTNPDFEPDDFALQIFHDCTQAIELQQMSSALAKDVLDYRSRKAAWNWNASGSSSVHERADSVSDAVDPVSHSELYSSPEPRLATQDNRNSPPSTQPPSYRERSLPHPRGRMHFTASEGESSTSDTGAYADTSPEIETHSSLRHDLPRQRNPHRRSLSIDRRANLEESKRYTEQAAADIKDAKLAEEKRAAAEQAKLLSEAAQRATREAEQKAAKERSSLAAAHSKALQERDEIERELDEAKRLAGGKTTAPIIFHSLDGRKFECPWNSCRTWEGMKKFIDEISSGSAQFRDVVRRKEYDLVRGDDVIVLPQFWDNTVLPGSTITMRDRNPAEKKVPWFERVVDSIRER